MPLEWGVIWTFEDDEKVITKSPTTGTTYANADQVKEDIARFPWLNGQAVYRVVSDWKVPGKKTVDAIPEAQTLEQYERDVMAAKVRQIEAERRAVRQSR